MSEPKTLPKTLPEAINECRQMGVALDAMLPGLKRDSVIRLACAALCFGLGAWALGDRSSWISYLAAITNFATVGYLAGHVHRDWKRWATARGEVAGTLHWLLQRYSGAPSGPAEVWSSLSADARRILGK